MGFLVTLDIETVPLEWEELSQTQQSEKLRKADLYLKSHPEASEKEAFDLIGGTSPFFGRIVVLGVDIYNEATNMHKAFKLEAPKTEDEKEAIAIFYNLIKQLPPRQTTYVHYNGINFDIPFILRRSLLYKLDPPTKEFVQLKKFSTFPHLDLKEWLSNWYAQNAVTLELACDFAGIPSSKDGEVKASGVYEAFKEGKLGLIGDYCMRDVNATFELYQRFKDYLP